MDYIINPQRQQFLKWIERRTNQQRGSLIVGDYGVGKTAFLKELKKRYPNAMIANPLGSPCQLIGEMCGLSEIAYLRKNRYLQQLKDHPRLIIIDEAQHLRTDFYPYLKMIADWGNTLILSGLVELADLLKERHPDILSRLMVMTLKPLSVDEFEHSLSGLFDEGAIKTINGAANSMRELVETIDDCLLYIHEKGLAKVSEDIAYRIAYAEDID